MVNRDLSLRHSKTSQDTIVLAMQILIIEADHTTIETNQVLIVYDVGPYYLQFDLIILLAISIKSSSDPSSLSKLTAFMTSLTLFKL